MDTMTERYWWFPVFLWQETRQLWIEEDEEDEEEQEEKDQKMKVRGHQLSDDNEEDGGGIKKEESISH